MSVRADERLIVHQVIAAKNGLREGTERGVDRARLLPSHEGLDPRGAGSEYDKRRDPYPSSFHGSILPRDRRGPHRSGAAHPSHSRAASTRRLPAIRSRRRVWLTIRTLAVRFLPGLPLARERGPS